MRILLANTQRVWISTIFERFLCTREHSSSCVHNFWTRCPTDFNKSSLKSSFRALSSGRIFNIFWKLYLPENSQYLRKPTSWGVKSSKLNVTLRQTGSKIALIKGCYGLAFCEYFQVFLRLFCDFDDFGRFRPKNRKKSAQKLDFRRSPNTKHPRNQRKHVENHRKWQFRVK